MFLSTSLQSSGFARFLKPFFSKLSATRTLRLRRSLCLRHLGDIVCFYLRVLPLSVCLLNAVGLLQVLQQFGVIPFEFKTLRKGHTEQRKTQRFYIAEIVRHRGTVGAWSSREYLRVLLMFLSTSLQSICFARFLKTFFSKLSATRTLRLRRSLCLRHLRNIVFYAFTSVFSVALCDNTSKF